MAIVRKTGWTIDTTTSSGSVSISIPSGDRRILAMTHWGGAPTSFGGLTPTRVGTTQWWYWTEAQLATLSSSETYVYTGGPFGYAFLTGVDQDNIVADSNIDTASNNYTFTGLPTNRLIVVTGFAARSGAYPLGYGVFNLTTQASYQNIISTYRHYRIADEGSTTGADFEIPTQSADGSVNMFWSTAITRYDHAWAIGGYDAGTPETISVDTLSISHTENDVTLITPTTIGADTLSTSINTQAPNVKADEGIPVDVLAHTITENDADVIDDDSVVVELLSLNQTLNDVAVNVKVTISVDTLSINQTEQAPTIIAALPFPVLAATQDSGGAGTQTSISPAINFAGAVGDMEILYVVVGNVLNITTPSGWQVLAHHQVNSGFRPHTQAIYYRILTESHLATATVTLNFSTNINASGILFQKITGANNIQLSELSFSGANPNPPSLTPISGQQSYKWFAVRMANDDETVTLPSGYTSSGSRGLNWYIQTGTKDAVATSEDPGAFTNAFSSDGYVYTIATWYSTPQIIVAVDTKAINQTELAPTVNAREIVGVDTSSVLVTTYEVKTPTLMFVDTLAITQTTFDPEVDESFIIDALAIAVTTNDVAVNEAEAIAVDAASLTQTTFDVTINESTVVAVDAAPQTITTNDVVVSAADNVTVDSTSIAVTTNDITINGADVVSVDAAAITQTLNDARIDEVVGVDTLSITTTTNDVAVKILTSKVPVVVGQTGFDGNAVSVGGANIGWIVPLPAVEAGATILVFFVADGLASFSVSGYTPIVNTGDSQTRWVAAVKKSDGTETSFTVVKSGSADVTRARAAVYVVRADYLSYTTASFTASNVTTIDYPLASGSGYIVANLPSFNGSSRVDRVNTYHFAAAMFHDVNDFSRSLGGPPTGWSSSYNYSSFNYPGLRTSVRLGQELFDPSTGTFSGTVRAVGVNVAFWNDMIEVLDPVSIDTLAQTISPQDARVLANELVELEVSELSVNTQPVVVNAVENVVVDAAAISITNNAAVINASTIIPVDALTQTVTTAGINLNAREIVFVDTRGVTQTLYTPLVNNQVIEIESLSLAIALLSPNVGADDVVAVDTASLTQTLNDINLNARDVVAIDTRTIVETLFDVRAVENQRVQIDTVAINQTLNDINLNARENIAVNVYQITVTTNEAFAGELIRPRFLAVRTSSWTGDGNESTIKTNLQAFEVVYQDGQWTVPTPASAEHIHEIDSGEWTLPSPPQGTWIQ